MFVDSQRLRVSVYNVFRVHRQHVHMLKTCSRYTRRRFGCTHGGRFESAHGVFQCVTPHSVSHIDTTTTPHSHAHQHTHQHTHPQTDTTQRPDTPHNVHTQHNGHRDREGERGDKRRDEREGEETEKMTDTCVSVSAYATSSILFGRDFTTKPLGYA